MTSEQRLAALILTAFLILVPGIFGLAVWASNSQSTPHQVIAAGYSSGAAPTATPYVAPTIKASETVTGSQGTFPTSASPADFCGLKVGDPQAHVVSVMGAGVVVTINIGNLSGSDMLYQGSNGTLIYGVQIHKGIVSRLGAWKAKPRPNLFTVKPNAEIPCLADRA